MFLSMATPAAALRDALAQLAESSDRTSPPVFVGRTGEFDLLDAAVRGVQRGEVGHTTVVQGVPGAGKTALLEEYATRLLLANDDGEAQVVPVKLRPRDVNDSPAAIVETIERGFRNIRESGEWGRMASRAVDGASLAANAVFAAFAKRDFSQFRPSARAPDSLSIALDDYVEFRIGRRNSTIVLLVDEAQNLSDTTRVRDHLDALHGGIRGRTRAVLACFGLTNTVERLRTLGLSRLASGHALSIGALSSEDAKRSVTGTLELALAAHTFNDAKRERWIGAAADVILLEGANFPHHLANGCRALAQILLVEDIDAAPPLEKLRERCREYRREYYEARLEPWSRHTIALAHVFGDGSNAPKPIERIVAALAASDNYGRAVDESAAATVVEELCASGYVEENLGAFRLGLPSLATHFAELRRGMLEPNRAAQRIRAACGVESV